MKAPGSKYDQFFVEEFAKKIKTNENMQSVLEEVENFK